MEASDAVALGKLYEFAVDCDVFKGFSQSLEKHIEVSLPVTDTDCTWLTRGRTV
jgi:hypothetical protein